MPEQSKKRFQLGEYWLSQRPNSTQCCRTWFDRQKHQTRRASLSTDDFESAKVALAAWFTLHGSRDREEPRSVVLATVCARYQEKQGQHVGSAGVQRRNLTLILKAVPASTAEGECTL
jgi:hypothetical protein